MPRIVRVVWVVRVWMVWVVWVVGVRVVWMMRVVLVERTAVFIMKPPTVLLSDFIMAWVATTFVAAGPITIVPMVAGFVT